MHRDNWDDLRFVLAVAEHGSLAAAARALGVNHATVLRRIAAFEQSHGLTLFERSPAGYRIPPERLKVIEAAREVAAAVDAVSRTLRGAGAAPAGRVRVTSTDSLCVAVLPEILAEISSEMPELRLDLVAANERLDLARLSAEIAVRPAMSLPDDLSGEIGAELGFAVYAQRVQGERCRQWLGLGGTLARTPLADWLAGQAEPERIAGGADSFVVLAGMAAAGLGRAVLPCPLGESDARLVRLAAPQPELRVPIWVACHAELADVPRLATLRRRILRGLARRAAYLACGVRA
ncbi:DNA-binding transcriptional regulator, LysR family [Meinhardsimonia xiamenensis]|jgi:DNA-binding transcriptional LysR family regulator|uniref:DNA-binding transcriptional regulator, LysR family n=1 Tax=Meinhardsimonia xiamenensis TaxID=990712 RepID=A0A1G9BC90_9RHOB|nr:LysR family transcriptional regulator [Meinhardsimonia xiamenensis]PRX35033.1 DNA-binding transcriptional LysR family regulator [Meinhardsimonia xiamenensis]SDK37093.1 DNA-binding transcriptional regulator, LysR family [Meinhardsimonia xiamenensis]